jgi:hypothetical protein
VKKAGFFLLVSIFSGALACVAPGPATDDSAEVAEENVAEAQSEVIIPCVDSCVCDLGYFCYVPAGYSEGSCIPDLAGPTAPVCFEDCQCPAGQLCGPWMVCQTPECSTDCGCDAGLYCYRGQCLDDPFSNVECTATCQCGMGETCVGGQCESDGYGYQEP